MNTINLASFDSEKYWNTSSTITLPKINNPLITNIIQQLDELLFVFCTPSDLLITHSPFSVELKEYLYTSLGISFYDYHIPYGNHTENLFTNWCTDKILVEKIREYKNLNYYSVVPGLQNIVDLNSKFDPIPSLEAVSRCNSKIFSYKLCENINALTYGKHVDSSQTFKQLAYSMLEKGSFLIKEPFGVSGNGNFLISSKKQLVSIIHYFESKEGQGGQLNLIIEPYLDKKIDFSCIIFIAKNGHITVISTQIMQNKKFIFSGIISASDEFVEFLKSKKYFETILHAAENLYDQGYWGYVCFDSMVLQNEDIIPILEINARMSMGLIFQKLRTYIPKEFFSKLSYSNLNVPRNIKFKDLLDLLKKNDLLSNKKNSYSGIIPISANAFMVNRDIQQDEFFISRLYYFVIGITEKNIDLLESKLMQLLEQNTMRKI